MSILDKNCCGRAQSLSLASWITGHVLLSCLTWQAVEHSYIFMTPRSQEVIIIKIIIRIKVIIIITIFMITIIITSFKHKTDKNNNFVSLNEWLIYNPLWFESHCLPQILMSFETTLGVDDNVAIMIFGERMWKCAVWSILSSGHSSLLPASFFP